MAAFEHNVTFEDAVCASSIVDGREVEIALKRVLAVEIGQD